MLRLDVLVVLERRAHRDLLRRGHHQSEVLAHREQLADHGRVAGHERAPVAGKVGPLRQRVHREDPGRVAAADVGVQHADRSLGPGALEVALVGHQQRPPLPAPVDDLAQVVDRQHPAGRVGRRVDPDQRDAFRADRGEGVGRDRARTGQSGTDLVGRVGELRDHDQVARAEPELGGQRAHELLGADRGQHGVEPETGDAEPTLQPVEARLPGVSPADGDRVAGGVGGFAKRGLHHLGRRVHRRADGQVDDAVLVAARGLGVRREVVPREVREALADLHRRGRPVTPGSAAGGRRSVGGPCR